MSTTTSKGESEIAEIPAGNDLPEGWATAPLSDIVCKLVDGSHNPPPKQTEGHPMFSARNISDGSLLLNEGYRLISGKDFKVEHARTQVTPGDVLLTIVGSIGRSLVVPDDTQAFALQRSVAVIRPLFVDPKFLAFDFRAPDSQAFFRDNGAGTAQKGVYLRTLSSMPVSLAPLHEQRRIVAKIEDLFTQANATRTRLAKVSQTLKRFRQAVLAAACSGRLTEEWRERNPQASPTLPNEPGKRPLPPVSEDEMFFETPQNWRWVRLGSLAVFINGDRGKNYPNKSEYVAKGIPFINAGHIQSDGSLALDSMNYISKEQFNSLRDGKITRGDLIYCLRGTLGKTAFVEPYEEGAIASSLVIIRPSCALDRAFAYYFLTSPYGKDLVNRFDNGSAQPNLSANSVKHYACPLPSLEEQREIVRRVEVLFKLADSIEKRVEAATKRTDKLTQAILAKAFRGELVPTEAELARREGREYEPASKLLARIKAKTGEAKQAPSPTRKSRRRY